MGGFGEFFRKAIFVEPVMVWSLMMYGTAVSIAVLTPTLKPYFTRVEPKTPPSLKDTIAGIQERLATKAPGTGAIR
ncbi:hypothetical protein FOA52_004672 [Chlamydomonas sp. UWO 241]|nr:hypothetical protein FOA52_004672 [Chlamydomonas sp. UWO 241]